MNDPTNESEALPLLDELTHYIAEGDIGAVDKFLNTHNLFFINMSNSKGEAPLSVAAESGFLDAVMLLVAWGADLEGTGKARWTPLMCAALNNHVEVAEYLIKKGAAVERPEGYEGWSAVFVAAFQGNKEVLRLLLENGAVWDRRDGIDGTGHTPSEYAKINDHHDVCEMLKAWPLELEKRAKVKNEGNAREMKIAQLKQRKSSNPFKVR